MLPPLAFSQALILRIVPQAVKSFGSIEIEIVPTDPVFEAQKRFDPFQFGDGIFDEAIAVYNQQLLTREHLQQSKLSLFLNENSI